MRIPTLSDERAETPAPQPDDASGTVQTWREHGQICAYGYAAEGADWMRVPDVATYRLGDEVIAFGDPGASHLSIQAAFERSVLPMAIQLLGGNALHASAVLGPAGVVAFAGESGAGKSTAAHALALRGYPLWADDAVAFECIDSVCRTTRLPFELQLRPDAAARAGAAHGAAVATPSVAPLAKIVVLRRGASAELVTAHPPAGDVYRDVLEQAYCFRPDAEQPARSLVDAYLTLVSRVALVEVEYAPDWAEFDALIDTLEQITRSAAPRR